MSDQNKASRECGDLADRFSKLEEKDVSKTIDGESDWSVAQEFVKKAREEVGQHDPADPSVQEIERKLQEVEDIIAGNNSYDLGKGMSRLCNEIYNVIDKNNLEAVMVEFEATLVPKVIELTERDSVTLEEYQSMVEELEDFLRNAQNKVDAKE